jgi:hypothetical protein
MATRDLDTWRSFFELPSASWNMFKRAHLGRSRDARVYSVGLCTRKYLELLGISPAECRFYMRLTEGGTMCLDTIPAKFDARCHVCGAQCRAPTPGSPVYFGASHSGYPYVYSDDGQPMAITGGQTGKTTRQLILSYCPCMLLRTNTPSWQP